MKQINNLLNPISRLGNKKYSVWFAFFFVFLIAICSEIVAYGIFKNPNIVGTYIIFIHIACIVYFSFRDGIKGGVTATFISIAYYFYIIYSREYAGNMLRSSIETTLVLGIIYFFIALVIGWLKQTIDILIHREADEKKRLRTIIEQLPVGVVITDNNGNITQANKKIDAILGFKFPVGFRVGGESALLETKERGKMVEASNGPLSQTIQTGKPILGKEYMVKRKDGKIVYMQISTAPIYNNEGKFIAAASITNDITQQRELETRKDDFINMASHELKTPITSMKLYVESLLSKVKQTDDEQMTRVITRIMYQTEKLQDLVSDLLDVSKIQTGRLTFTREVFVINELIEETVQELQESCPAHKLTFDSKKKTKVYADKFRVYQVLTNLITNAVKYSPDGGKIAIKISSEDKKVTVSITDKGIGIPKHQQKKIFEKLYQVTDPKEKTFPGLGMGLYISKEIVKRHKGSIWVKSVTNKGSTFSFTLPTASFGKD